MTPVTEVSSGPFIFVSRKTALFKTVGDLVAYGKANPGKDVYKRQSVSRDGSAAVP